MEGALVLSPLQMTDGLGIQGSEEFQEALESKDFLELCGACPTVITVEIFPPAL